MVFQYEPERQTAVDNELGLKLRKDHRYRDTGMAGVKLTDVRSGRDWSFAIIYEKGSLIYDSEQGPRTYLGEVACRIPRLKVEWIVRELAPLKAAQGISATPHQILEAVRMGVFELTSRGGLRLKNAPGYFVEWCE